MAITGGFRTQRNQSAVNGTRTLASILASDGNGAGAGSFRRVYSWYYHNTNPDVKYFYRDQLHGRYGQYAGRPEYGFYRNVI
jgi:hypothetical protein